MTEHRGRALASLSSIFATVSVHSLVGEQIKSSGKCLGQRYMVTLRSGPVNLNVKPPTAATKYV